MEVEIEEEVKIQEETKQEINIQEVDNNKEIAFAPVILDQDEIKNKEKIDQLAIDNELQRAVRSNETVYKSQLSKLLNYGLKFELKGQDPVGINGCVFLPDIIYTVGNRIISPDGVFLITNDLMQCALTIDSAAIKNEKKITSAGGGSVEITDRGGIIIQTTKT